ncbi:hypothetical protein BOTBODRAFT_190467 [Botryobasidium botryosum FD-172 SS1]|uniref:protein-histidine N-methyltransferase n=1 Tax=Botryobasidium botryosum (strain FD-172 SS1) TaxID=930990 RepID=A0A067MF46_BOTB1|nr:hypothetical protein BOTBODRAFT_190467 [Botryobasidium botryosum FD-172 SS1]
MFASGSGESRVFGQGIYTFGFCLDIASGVSGRVSPRGLDTLPPKLSYSPLKVIVTPETSVTVHRRDLFDARFQLISSGVLDVEPSPSAEATASDLEFVSAPSDLVPGLYEGGLKTWECSLDLIKCLHGFLSDGLENNEEASPSRGRAIRGKNILDVGCGTALPSVYLLQEILNISPPGYGDRSKTTIHLQDYNRSVFELVTLPNIILAWYHSLASQSYCASLPPPSPTDQDQGDEFEIELSPELLGAFTASLSEHHVEFRFFTGSWASLADALPIIHESDMERQNDQPLYDLVFTSETIYRLESLPSLIRLLRAGTSTSSQSSVAETPERLRTLSSLSISQSPRCLVAAKLLYFGVGGGVDSFVQQVEQQGGKVQTVWEENEGLWRRIMRIEWV